MISKELKELLNPVILVQKILWFVIFGSVIFYIAFVYIFVDGNLTLTFSSGGDFEILIYFLALAAAAGSVYYYRHSLSDKNLKSFMTNDFDIELLARNPRTREIDEAKFLSLKTLTKDELGIYSLMFEYQKIIMITLILNEIIVILGSVLSFINDDVSKIVPFGIVSVALCFWVFPRPHILITRAQNL